MLLAVDIGNTHTVAGIYDGEELKAHWRAATSPGATEDELWMVFHAFLEDAGIGVDELDAVVVASVVPALTDAIEGVCTRRLGAPPLIVSSDLDLGIDIAVDPPESTGADRLANAVAVNSRYSVPAVVVDMGTATTFDVVDDSGTYLGGVIAPGVLTGSEELFRRAARLAKVEIHPPEKVIGSTTDSSLRSGVYLGTLSMIDGLIEKINAELGAEPVVVFTGGLCVLFEDDFHKRGIVDPLLTLEGLRLIYERAS